MVKPAEQQHGNQGCPNLNAQSIFCSADESFDLEILLEGFEEHFDLPALFINAGDGSRREVQEVRDQSQGLIVTIDAKRDAAKRITTTPPLARLNCAQGNKLRHREIVVESNDNNLFLNRKRVRRAPNNCCSRKRFKALWKRSSNNAA